MMTYEEAVYYLEHAAAFGIKPGLQRIRELLRRLDNPQDKYRTIHVTGTNGKGSVTAMIAAGLTAAGCKTGRYTSPHLEAYTERIRIDGEDIAPDDFAAVTAAVAAAVEAMAADRWERPTEFEMLTAMAFLYFFRCRVDYAVIEVGLGGLLDSTNVIMPHLSVITNVALDHMAYCGDTVEKIAVHKAGIIKHAVPVVTAATEPALAVIAEKARNGKCPLYRCDRDFHLGSCTVRSVRNTYVQDSTVIFDEGDRLTVTTALVGAHQGRNAALAVMALRLLRPCIGALTDDVICRALTGVSWPGRFQIVEQNGQTVVIDGAHNPAGIDTFCQTYDAVFGKRRRVFVFAVLADKDYSQMMGRLFRQDDLVFCAPAPSPRTADPEKLVAAIPCRAEPCATLTAALARAFAAATTEKVLAVVGSLYIQGEVRRYLRQKGFTV